VPLQVLVAPPRPPELPVAVPPPMVGEAPVKTGPHLRNDAHLANWTDEFIRIMKDAWVKLGKVIQSIEDRLLALEMRVADTYTYGQKGVITLAVPIEEGGPIPLTILALPLRVVRDEVLLEVVATCEVAGATGGTTFKVQHGPSAAAMADVTTLTLNTGALLAQITLPTPRPMKRNDVLRVIVTAVSLEAADFVVQVRCR
jgi:hypothetical protein